MRSLLWVRIPCFVSESGGAAEIFLIMGGPATVFTDVLWISYQFFHFFKVILQLTDVLVMSFTAISHCDSSLFFLFYSDNRCKQEVKVLCRPAGNQMPYRILTTR